MGGARLDLGVGVIATAGLDLVWEQVADLVDVIEVEPQTMWTPRPVGGWDINEASFEWVERRTKPILVHGVGFPVGGCEAPDPDGVELTAACADRLGASHWSEHLSFNRARINGQIVDAGFLLPPAQTEAGVEAAVDHVQAYTRSAVRPFLIETGVNYLQPRAGELSDGRFIADIALRADCGILLDLHNLLTNQRNGRQSVDEVLSELPLDRVLEVHVAGGFATDGYYLDAHIGGPDAELFAITETVVARLPNLRAVIFEAVPESMIMLGATGLRAVLEHLQRICAPAGRHGGGSWSRPRRTRKARAVDTRPATSGATPVVPCRQSELDATRAWERGLAAYTARMVCDQPGSDRGYQVLRALADQARLGQLTLAQPDLLRALIHRLGIDDVERLLDDYLNQFAPRRWSAQEGAQFAQWLATAAG
jgi:uncharacterized protein (UPF0276 family)